MKYTKPALRERIKKRIMAGTKGGRSGQWSARKSQLLVTAYEKAGGGYKGGKGKKQKSLERWTKQEWTTPSGKPSKEKNEVYLPKRALAALKSTSSGRAKLARANRIKKAATEKGKQFAKTGLHAGKKR